MGEEGICKHVCASILSYMNRGKTSSDSIGTPIPFSELDPLKDWTIKARIIKKSNPRQWVNEQGSGKVCSILIRDELDGTSEMRAIMFNEAVDEFYDNLQEGKVYYISRAHLKPTNPNFKDSRTQNEFEINIVPTSIIKSAKQVLFLFQTNT